MACTVQSLKATDGSTYAVDVAFIDESGNSVVPNSVTWSLLDVNGGFINSREDVSAPPSATITIVLYGDDIQQENGKYMYLTVKASYNSSLGSNLPLVEQTRIEICELVE